MVGDDDGVVIVPEALIDDIVTAAVKKRAALRAQIRQAVRDGLPTSRASSA